MDSKKHRVSSNAEEKPKIINKLTWRQFFYAGLESGAISEDSRRVFMINLFSLVGVVFTLPLGISSLSNGKPILGLCLVSIALVYSCNHIFLRYTHNHLLSGGLIIYPLYVLMLGLVYFGGIEGTGHLWVYCVPAVAFFINGLKKGLLEIALFTLALVGMMFLKNAGFESYEYADSLKLRILLSFLVVVFLSGIYEYSMSLYNEELQKTSKKLEFLAETDVLTGLLNRRGLQKRLEECENKKRHLLLADVDHFKKVNDTYGHSAGDLVLNDLAKLIKQINSSFNVAARWGGEEFLIAIKGVSTSEAVEMAETFRKNVEAHEFVFGGKRFHLTLSVGVAAMNDDTTLETALKLADSGLYHAKNSGRNRTSLGQL